MFDLIDRDGLPLPADYFDKEKHGQKFRWGTQQRVARTEVGGFLVSTVWLMGIDHAHGGPAPLLFETMVFDRRVDPQWDNELQRYSTEEQAMRGHLVVLERLRSGKPPFSYLDDDYEVGL